MSFIRAPMSLARPIYNEILDLSEHCFDWSQYGASNLGVYNLGLSVFGLLWTRAYSLESTLGAYRLGVPSLQLIGTPRDENPIT